MTDLNNPPALDTIPLAITYTAARGALLDRIAIMAAGGAGEFSLANAALLARLVLLAAGGAGELTPARAALLSNLNGLISGRLGPVNSIQRGTIALATAVASGTATITAVVLARSQLRFQGGSYANADDTNFGAIDLTNATTVTYTRTGSTGATTVGYEVVEAAA